MQNFLRETKLKFSNLLPFFIGPSSYLSENHKMEPSPIYSKLFEEVELPCIKWAHFGNIYDEVFAEIRTKKELRILEIGVQGGGSQMILRKYFCDDAKVMGIDVNPEIQDLETDTLIRIGDAKDSDFLLECVKELGGLDIVIDDGSHLSVDQRKTFEILFPILAVGGLYLVEDLEHSYFARSRSVPFFPNTFWNYSKRTTELLNDSFRKYKKLCTLKTSDENLWSIQFYPQVIVFKKKSRSLPQIARNYPKEVNL